MRILLVDDNQPTHGFAAWLAYETGYEIKTALDTAVAFALLDEGWEPDAIILDLIMRDPDTGRLEYETPPGLVAAQLLNEMYPHIHLLIYSGHFEYFPAIQHLGQRTTAGFGYLLKGKTNSKLWEILQQVCQGQIYIDPEIEYHLDRQRLPLYPQAGQLLEMIQEAAANYHKLSGAEKEILAAIAQAHSSQEIGLQRETLPTTINQQVSTISHKLSLKVGNTRVVLAMLYWYIHHPHNPNRAI